VALVAAKLHGVPVFYWLAHPHGEASLHAASSGVAGDRLLYRLRVIVQRWLLYRVIMPACMHVFVQSEQMRRDVAREGIPLDRTTAVPSSLNLRDLDTTQAPADAAAATQPPTIVYLGTLLRERQLDFLVRAHALVVAEVPEARLTFVGSGWMPGDEQLLRDEAQRLGIAGHITITGWLPAPEAWQHVRRAALCVSHYPPPILRSTSPTKLIEYLALGKPVVANDHPEQADVLRQSGAGLVSGPSERELAAAMVELLKDPARCAQMGAAGRRYVAAHRTHWAMVELVAGCYRQHLLEPPKRPKPRAFARI
jgi:glycosyltransferase involved in cell wall biosynthesis